ncbi:dynein heavy chain [Phytophthora infestans T30-4]|uniref:Dynein heavy chain n=1 Tax=Phytophthora infestans (strain T30-4) TaxID=403677 RepID=D0N0A0_PHYIT|nr:dynein heavy chain [Phytophthora infestans T30-4]EEY65913.1 dynein heavy chain [Phytophthora infestans T30-4]|eukprot:XP_002906512.1 dynein heavy chain [Phytophthora infestans T30-4]
MMAVPMTTNERWLVWKFLCDWVKTQLAMEVPASIPGFGTFYLRVQSLGIRITFFEPDKQFLRKFCLQVDSEMPDPALATLSSTGSNSDALASTESISRAPSVVGLGDVFAFSFVEMAACCGNAVDLKRAQEWLHAVINKLGNAMSQCDRVELNIGVGVIVCGDCVIQRHLLSRDSRPPPRLDYEIRTGESVVKRKLLAQAALQTTPTPPTKYSFLSGSTFSSSIQLNPVLDRSKDVPDFSFGPPNPRRPTFHSVVATSDSKASPRPTQLHHQYHRSPSPRISRINASVTTESAPTDDRNEAETTYTLTKQEGEETSTTPQLFDRLSRTLFVEPDQNVSYLLPSNRIGSNFMPAAALLMTEKSASQYGQLTHHSGGVVFIEQPSFSGRSFRRQRKELLQNATPEQRYFEYLADDKFFDRSNLAPLPADLESRVVAAAVKYITGPSSDRLETVLEVAHQEFVDNYYTSAKKAILNYMLMRAESCERLEIPQGAPAHALLPIKWKWGSSDGPNGCIADLKTLRAQSKLMSLLIFSNPQVRALRYMWHEMFASITLVDLPSGEDLNGMEPMDIIQFERTQLAFSAKAKAFVMENWYMKAKMMFESAIQAETFSIHTSEAAVSFRLRHLFDTVSAVMSLQIRSLIMKSVQAYVNFFERFGVVNESQDSDDNVHYEARPTRPGLLMTLVLLGDQIQFRDPLVDIPSRLLNVLHNIPKLFTNLGRIETQFEEPILLSATSSPFLWNVVAQEDDIVVATIRIRAIIEQNLSYLRKLQTDYDMFALTHRYVNSVDCFHLEENSELETYRAEMERVQTTALRLAIDNRHSQHLGLFSVDCRHVNTRLHTDLARWTIRLLQAFEQRTGRMNAELRQQYKEIAARLAKTPLDLYELVDGEAFVKSLKSEKLQKLQEKGNVIKQRLRFLLFERENTHIGNVTADPSLESIDSEHKDFRLSLDLLSSTAKTLNWRSHIDKLLVEAESQLVNERSRIESMFIAKRSRFQAEIEEFEGEVRGFAKKGDLRHAATYVVQLAKMQDNIVNFRQAMTTIIQEEQKLQWKPTDFGKLDDIAEEMAPYERLWKTVREFREMNSKWLRGNVFELPGNEGMQTLQQMLTVVSDVSSVLILNSAAAAITAEAVRKQMTDFRENVRFLVAIQNPAMKERHMKAVSGLIGIDFTSEEAITLLKLLENGVFERIGDIVDISCNATQEQQIERALHEIRDEWEAISFNLVPSRHPITVSTALAPILSTDNGEPETVNIVLEKDCGEQIVSLMEDHLLRLQSLSCMAHAGPFIEEIAFWQTFASEMGQIVEMLVLVEHRWRRITPLFAAGIVENDSKSSRLFVSAAKLYQSSHATILRNPACAEYCQQSNTTVDLDQTPKSPATSLISDLEECHEILETVRADVRVGFESKQASFSRFYYLSDLELVTALALAEVPSDVSLWKALSRCFPGIHSVQTNPANEITALLSSVGEPFPLGSAITTKDTSMPTWLTKLETSMTTILHASIRAACSDLPRKEFRKWCLVWPEQSLLVAIQHTWTLESEQAYQNANQRKAWTEITEKILQNTDAVWKEMRVTAYPHAKVALANTILLLTQLRDVSASALADVGGMWVEESDEKKSERHTFPHFSPSLCWAAQPRFYFIDSVLSVTMMTSSYLPYGLEYLGNGSSGMLVTPLTLRCYHAVAQAVSTMTKGVCLEGTAGTGKSTICHQLARLCGRLYVTFQCANKKLVFNELVNYVKATASSGAWLCIDNFQLLNAVNVSLIKMLCAQVMNGLAARHAQCTLVGDRVRLRRGALFFLTLTTGHGASGNEQLVQEARFFFRTIVVQSPDIEKLAEFEFQNARFVHASELAKLLTVALRSFERGFEMMNHPSATTNETNILGSRLANLRVVKNVVIRAAELNDAEKEHRRRTRRSLLISDEEHEEVSATQEPIPNDTTAEAIAKRDEEVVEHQCVFLAIQECIGSVVPAAYLHLINAAIEPTLVAPTRCVVVCPRALQLDQLLSVEAEDQSRSVLFKLLQEAKTLHRTDKRTQTWLVFDGDLDPLWSEQLLYTVEELQDDIPGYRKGLRLSSGKVLVVPHYVHVVMETTTLTNASPSFLSRIGVVHVGGCEVSQKWENVYAVWKILRKAEFEKYGGLIFGILDTLVSELVPVTLEFVDVNFQNYTNIGQGMERVQWMLAFFHSSLNQSWKKFCSLTSEKQRNTAVHCLFLQALVWGVGSTTDVEERRKFHVFLYDFILHGPNNEQSTLKRLVLLFFPTGILVGSVSSNVDGSKSNTNTVLVFVDDLQCFDPNRRMDSSLELFRMLAEYQTVVDPVTSLVTKCKHVVPFATLQLPTPSVERSHTRSDDIGRLLHRFIPIGLLPFSDSDLTSICESISHSNTTLSQPPGTPFTSSGKGTHTATVKDSENLLSIVVKASLKLYRLLTSSNDVSIFSKKATFNPVKLHYNFRVAQLFRLVTTICCEIRPSLSPAEKPALSRLWCHESARVFGDNIIDSKESLSFHQHTIDIALATFGVATEAFFPARFDTQDLQDQSIAQNWFANDLYFSYMGDSPTGVYRHGYHEVTDIPKLELLVERSMMAMTSSTSSSPESMEITMCTYVIKHILRLSRLLRMGTKAVLLLGASGRKLVTITRLACFICKRVSAIYRIPGDLGRPNEEMTDRSKWNATFRTAMLKSIRARDTSLVFIVKDNYLHPDAYPYRIIDKFLGGHNLPPDVIAYEHLDEEILAVLREREQSPAQVTRSNSRKSVTTLHQTPPMHRSKSALLDYFFQCVRQKLQLVLVLSLTEPKNWTSILWRFPNILKCCDVNYAGPWSTDDLVTMARKSLKQSTVATDALSAMKYSEAAVQVYEATMLMDHLSLFTSHYDQVHGTVSSNMARFKAGLEFIDQTAQILKTEQTQADLLLPEMLEKTELRRRMSGSWERERIATDKVTRALELATTLAVAQRERLAMVTQEYHNLIKDSRDAFDQIKSSLQKFHEACNTGSVNEVDTEMVARRRLHRQIREFASLNRIPSSIYQLSECIGVILGFEPVEGRDEMDPDETIMNYWANVAMQVNSTAFWKTLSTFDARDVTEKMLSVLLPICRSPDFDKDLFASVHEVAGVLCEWVQKCTAFARDFVLALPKQAQLEREKELLKEAEKRVDKTKVEIYNQSTSAQQAGAQRDLSEQERQRADEKLHDTTSQLQLTSAAWKVLFSTREKWQQRYDAYTELAEHWKGDLLLATAVVSYASCLNYSSELAKMNLNGVQVDDESTLESAVIALNCYRSPLLIDPYGVASDWLKKQLGAGKVAVASGNNTTTNAGVWKEVATSIKQQTSLIIMDICEDRLQGLHSFVESKRRAMFDAVNRDITVSRNGSGYRCWCYPPEDPTEETDAVETPAFEFSSDACRVFFVYTDSNVIPEWMSKYLSQLTVIQFELTASFVESQALHKVLESQGRLREVTEIRTLQQEMVICDEQIYGLEEELLEFFNTEKTEVVYSDNSKALRIIANRRAVNTLQSTKTEAMATIQTHWDSLKSYAAVARRCLDGVWAWREFNFLDNRDFACTEKLLPLSRVWQLLVRAGELSNKNDTNLEEVMACFTGCLQQYVSMNLRDEECLLFRFLLAFRIWQRLGPQSDRDPCRPTMKSLLALRPTGVKAKAWSVVCYLAEASGTLRQFISTMQSMESGQTAWQLLFEQDTMMSSEWNTPVPLDVFMRLCIVVAVHPQRFLGELEDFAERELKRIHLAPVTATFCSLTVTETSAPSLPTLVAAAAHSAPDRLRDLYYMWQSFSSARTPIVVPCPPTIDFVGAVANVARRAGATIDTGDTIQLLLSDEADFKKLVLLAMEKGQWIVLPNLHSSHGRLEQLNSIYELLGDKNVHSDFRLWISIRNKPACTRHFESMLISQRAIRREWGRGCISLKRSLQHTFNILKQELDGLMLNSTVGTLTSASVLGEKEERCIKQFGVFHAFVSFWRYGTVHGPSFNGGSGHREGNAR